LFEILTLAQTNKLNKRIPIVLYGTEFWNEVVDFEALVRHKVIDREDLDLFFKTDSVDEAYDYITSELHEHAVERPGWGL